MEAVNAAPVEAILVELRDGKSWRVRRARRRKWGMREISLIEAGGGSLGVYREIDWLWDSSTPFLPCSCCFDSFFSSQMNESPQRRSPDLKLGNLHSGLQFFRFARVQV